MNRELKFRGFHKIDKIMVYDLNSPRLLHGKLVSEDNDYILMQYIGREDKNGLCIYEGDIIIDDGIHYKNKPKFGIVSFEDGCFVLSNEGYQSDSFFYLLSEDLEVIGNIHENPELLENNECL